MFWPKVNWKFPDYFCVLILLLLMLMLFLFWIKLLFRFVYCVIDVVVTVAGSRWLLSWIVWFKCRLVVTLKRTCVVRILRARMSLLSSFFNSLLTCSLPIDLPICRSVFSLSTKRNRFSPGNLLFYSFSCNSNAWKWMKKKKMKRAKEPCMPKSVARRVAERKTYDFYTQTKKQVRKLKIEIACLWKNCVVCVCGSSYLCVFVLFTWSQ